MPNSKFKDKLIFSKELPENETIIKFLSPKPLITGCNDVLLAVNKAFLDKIELKKLIKKEYGTLLKDKLPQEFSGEKQFINLETKDEFAVFLAITLVSLRSLSEEERRIIKPGISYDEDGVLLVALDKKQLDLSDYCTAISEFVKQHKIKLREDNVCYKANLSLKDIENMKSEI